MRILESVNDLVDLTPNPAHKDKQKFKALLQDEAAGPLEIWTDGAKKANTQLGTGIRLIRQDTQEHLMDLAWKVTGIQGVMGAEIAPLAKILKWAHPALQLTMHTDSQATIDAWNKLKRQAYTERALAKHPERNALLLIKNQLEAKPHLAHLIQLRKVTSHVGVLGNEAADLLATLGASGTHAAYVTLKESTEYIALDETAQPILGDIRKRAKQQNRQKHRDRWVAGHGPQSVGAKELSARNTPHIPGPRRTILSNRKYTREINSIMLKQHEWNYGAASQIPTEKRCKLCEQHYSSASHRMFQCIGPVTDMLLAMLKHKWREPCPIAAQMPGWLRKHVDQLNGTRTGAALRTTISHRDPAHPHTGVSRKDVSNKMAAFTTDQQQKLLRFLKTSLHDKQQTCHDWKLLPL